METIKIDGRDYDIKTTFEDLTAYEFYKLINIKNKPIKEEYTKEELEIKETYSEDSEGFYRRYGKIYTSRDKGMDLIKSVCTISKKYINNYPELYKILIGIVLSNINNLLTPKIKEREYYNINNDRYYIDYEIKDWPFIKWCETETSFRYIETHTLLGFFATVLQKKNTKFDTFQSDFVLKLEYLKQLSAVEVVGSINRLLIEVDKIRKSNYFVYNNPYPVKNEGGGELSKILETIGWQDKIIQIAQTPIFNGPNGTLEAVKNAKTIDVLYYLNIKNARELAEGADYEKSMKKIKNK